MLINICEGKALCQTFCSWTNTPGQTHQKLDLKFSIFFFFMKLDIGQISYSELKSTEISFCRTKYYWIHIYFFFKWEALPQSYFNLRETCLQHMSYVEKHLNIIFTQIEIQKRIFLMKLVPVDARPNLAFVVCWSQFGNGLKPMNGKLDEYE